MNRSLAAGLAVLAVAAVPAAANAKTWSVETSFSGADFSRNNAANNELTVYDGEVDWHDVAGEYTPLGQKADNVSSAVNAGGAYTSVKPGVSVMRHRIVELVPNWNDDYGPWKYPH